MTSLTTSAGAEGVDPVESLVKLAETMAQKPLQMIKELLKLTSASKHFERTLRKV